MEIDFFINKELAIELDGIMNYFNDKMLIRKITETSTQKEMEQYRLALYIVERYGFLYKADNGFINPGGLWHAVMKAYKNEPFKKMHYHRERRKVYTGLKFLIPLFISIAAALLAYYGAIKAVSK